MKAEETLGTVQRHLRALLRAELLIAEIKLGALLKKTALGVVAGLIAGYLVVAQVEQTRGSPHWLGKRLYGFIFHDDKLIRKLNPDAMRWVRIPQDIGPIAMDERGWQVGHEAENDRQSLVEFVLPGETVNNWSELYTMQVIHGVPLHLGAADMIMTDENAETVRLPSCTVIEQEMLSQTATEVLYTQTLSQCAPMRDEYSVRKILRGPTTITEVSWSKTSPITDEERRRWTGLLGQVSFLSNCR